MINKVKGVLLCGGEGTRLRPLTSVTNKHLQRIGRKAMVDYPLEKLLEAGIVDIHVVVGGEHWPPVIKYIGSGKDRGANISYSVQDESGGIAQALGLARTFAGNDRVCVILGDNLFDMSLRESVKDFAENSGVYGARLFSTKVKDPERFGVLRRGKDGMPLEIIEKPKEPMGDEIITGIYMYTSDVFDLIRTLRPSDRGEFEVTALNNAYLRAVVAKVIPMTGNWTDCGEFETLHKAERMVTENDKP